jgi:hypothetical protein
MTLRRLVGWGWIGLFFAIGLFAIFANPIVSFMYFILGITYTAFHIVKYCADCTNVYCPLNSASVDFIFGNRYISVRAGYTDINAAKSAWPLVLIMLFPLYFIWLWNYFVVIGLVLFTIILLVAYVTNTCRFCTKTYYKNDKKETG